MKPTQLILEHLILGEIAKELKDEIQVGRQVKLAKSIIKHLIDAGLAVDVNQVKE